jgi:hypothetical protein
MRSTLPRLALGAAMAFAVGGLFAGGSPASADDVGGGATANGGGKYTVNVTVTGSGAGHGGSLAGPPVSSGGQVSVPSHCGYDKTLVTQEGLEAEYGGDKAKAEEALKSGVAQDNAINGRNDVSADWAAAELAHWGQKGTWYVGSCDSTQDINDLFAFNAHNPPFLSTDGNPPRVTWIPPQNLVEIAWRAMTLPDVTLLHDPAGNNPTYVNFDTYVWLNNGVGKVGDHLEVTASVGAEAATVVADSQSVTFSTDDGASVNCPSGGVAKDCPLRFTQVGKPRTISGTVHWTARTTQIPAGANPMGPVDQPMFGNVPITVQQIQSVNGN